MELARTKSVEARSIRLSIAYSKRSSKIEEALPAEKVYTELGSAEVLALFRKTIKA